MAFARALIFFGIVAGLVPAAGMMFGGEVLDAMHGQQLSGPPGTPAWSEVCVPGELPEGGWQRRGCLRYLSAFTAYYFGLTLFVIVALQTLFVTVMSLWTGRDSYRIARCFGWVSGLFVTVWSLSAVIRFVVVGGLLYLMLYWMDSQIMANWMKKLAFGVLFVPAAGLALSQLGAMFRIWRRPKSSGSLGCVARRHEAPTLYGFVEDIARRIGATQPAWLAVTIDANFSITDAPVRLPDLDEPLEGGVMLLSLPLMRLLTAEELAGVVAHELAHLADPLDEAKSAWAPAYGALMAEMDVDRSIWRLPANWYLGLVPAMFEEAVSETMRQGEANADEAALRVSRPEAAAAAFLKTVVADQAMSSHANINFDRLHTGVALENLSEEAADLARKALNRIDPPALLSHIRATFPDDGIEASVEQRIANFGMSLEDAVDVLARRAGKAGQPVDIGDISELERRVSRIVHRFQQAVAGEPGPLQEAEVESMAAFLER